ncbi:MAG: hypothetical protein HFE77_05970 [Clostridiales bacterium]|nr:hypothetical protein [Clostridiales bacterium]
MLYVLFIMLFAGALLPLALAGTGVIKRKKVALYVNVFSMIFVCVLMFALGVSAASPAEEGAVEAATTQASMGYGLGLLAAGLVTGLSCIGAGIAVSASASAAIGALSEKPEIFGKALIFVALAEGVALYGMLISIQILSKL